MNILSIQSAVACGHVGNSAAVFPLQRLGFETWPIDTVQLSSHTAHPAWRGRVFPASEIAEIVQGLDAVGALGRCDAVLSGYLGGAETGEAVLDAVRRVRAAKPGAVYCCDPVIGDAGRGVFVGDGIARFFAERALPAADIVTPNRFELEILSGRRAATLDDAVAAAKAILSRGPSVVLVTSVRQSDAAIETLAVDADGAWVVATPRLPFASGPHGAGDCLAALFLAHRLREAGTPHALSSAVSSLYAVLERTLREPDGELALVAAQDVIVRPPRLFPALPRG